MRTEAEWSDMDQKQLAQVLSGLTGLDQRTVLKVLQGDETVKRASKVLVETFRAQAEKALST